jgi:hypothetical protein
VHLEAFPLQVSSEQVGQVLLIFDYKRLNAHILILVVAAKQLCANAHPSIRGGKCYILLSGPRESKKAWNFRTVASVLLAKGSL